MLLIILLFIIYKTEAKIMKINKLITLCSSMVLTASALAAVLLFQNTESTGYKKVIAADKTFTFDKAVGSKWSDISAAGQVETTVSDPIVCSNATLHTEDEKNFNYGGSGCFYEQTIGSLTVVSTCPAAEMLDHLLPTVLSKVKVLSAAITFPYRIDSAF